MKLLNLVIMICFWFYGFGQSDSTITGIDFVCQSIDSKSETYLYTFSDKVPLPVDKCGYMNVNYTYKLDSKSKTVLYIKVHPDSADWHDQFYYQNGNLIKAIITKYLPSTPTTIFYLWNSNLIAQIPQTPLFWKAFNQLGYRVLEKVKEYKEARTIK